MSVVQWKEDAYTTLRKAQQVSSQAQICLDKTQHFLQVDTVARIQHVTAEVAHVHSRNKECGAILGRLQAHFSALSDAYKSDVERSLAPALRDLDAVQAQLRAVEVPGFLVRSQEHRVLHLDDFISTGELDSLRENIAVYKSNCQAVFSLVSSSLAEASSAWQTLSRQYGSFSSLSELPLYELQQLERFLVGLEDTKPRKNEPRANSAVRRILDQNEALGHELVSLLQMLTNHYDQCCRAISWKQHNSSQAENLAVLETDTLELPSVLREVYSIHDILSNNERNLARIVEPVNYERMTKACGELATGLAEFLQIRLAKLTLLVAHCDSIYHRTFLAPSADVPLKSFASVVNSLSHHYRQFCSVYQVQYLSELHYEQYVYPRKFLKLIDELFNEKLLAFEDEERQRRLAWLRRYGEFIPSSLSLPGDSEYPGVVQVVSEGLDNLSGPAAEAHEAKILDLIKSSAKRDGSF